MPITVIFQLFLTMIRKHTFDNNVSDNKPFKAYLQIMLRRLIKEKINNRQTMQLQPTIKNKAPQRQEYDPDIYTILAVRR